MPNTKRNVGLRPYGNPLRATVYTADGTIYAGDIVVQGSSGNVVQYSSSATAAVGVAANYAAGQGSQIIVWDHPDQQFIIQSDGGTPAGQTDIFQNYQVTATSGSATYKISRFQLTATSGGTVASMPLKASFLDPRGDNAFGTYADVVVYLNNHLYKGGTGQAGV